MAANPAAAEAGVTPVGATPVGAIPAGAAAPGPPLPVARRLAPLAALRPFLVPHMRLILLALVALTIAAAATLILPAAVRQIVDHGFDPSATRHIGRYFIGFLVVSAVLGVASASRYYLVLSLIHI